MTRIIPFTGRHNGQPHLSFAGAECPECGSTRTKSSAPERYQDTDSVVIYADTELSCTECKHCWKVGFREAAWKGLVRAGTRRVAAIALSILLAATPALAGDTEVFGRYELFSHKPSVEVRPSPRGDGSFDVYRDHEHQGRAVPTGRGDGSYRFEEDLNKPTYGTQPLFGPTQRK